MAKKKKKLIKRMSIRNLFKKKVSRKAKKRGEDRGLRLERAKHNPIIEPSDYPWESVATFNPAAVKLGNKIHLVYRAVGEGEVSSLGHASTYNGWYITERSPFSIYSKLFRHDEGEKKIDYISGGGWYGGCEDPRLTRIDDRIYLIYTAFNGWSSVRLALSSIRVKDFKKGNWGKWKRPVFLSPPGEIHKNWVLFPEKINGKFAIMHSITPEPLVDYLDDLDYFDDTKFLRSTFAQDPKRKKYWDNWVRGIGPTPIKTKDGWLILYHAMDKRDPNRYKLGAMLLDLKDPTKILHRSKSPILEPDKHYENDGHKWGVVYSCGAVVKNGELLVYYGGSDKVTAVAGIELEKLINSLKKDEKVKLNTNKLPRLKIKRKKKK
jgi:predicted GH43/DUF377 family glycosyl hydrolase